ncbi:hypothetical protein OAU50_07010, partial [Planctomycetota bacterium]|nr:hypothetical protein [Planctomycetota bacterium]
MRIIQSNFDSVVETFGATRRVATRLGALARTGLFVSETVMEVAHEADSKPLLRLLLAKALLDAAEAIDTAALKELATDEFFDDLPVMIANVEGQRVL